MKVKLLKKIMFAAKQVFYIFLLQLVTLQLINANELKSQNIEQVKISLNTGGTKLSEVFSTIENQTNFVFIYDTDVLKNETDCIINCKNKSGSDVLQNIATTYNLKFRMINNTIFVKEADIDSPSITEDGDTKQPTKKLSGKVKDTYGQTLPGVSVVVKGISMGTVTNVNGEFALNIPADAKTLQFSFIGMETQEVEINNEEYFSVTMKEESIGMEEVVVTALGIKRSKKTLAYSTQQVNIETLTTVRDISLGNALAGKVAGVSITSSTGASGVSGDPRIIIRGDRSISNNNQPLIVVDGIPISSSGGGLTSINPDDVVSMNVLKGPSASALYGSDANNGVIVITTKKGQEGISKIEINSSTTFDLPYLYPHLQNKYAQGSNGGYNSEADYLSWGPKMEGQTVTNWTGEDIKLSPHPDNVKDFFKTGYNCTNSVSYSTGNEKTNAYFSYSNTKARGVLEDNKMQRHNLNLRLESEILNKLKMDFKLTYFRQELEDMPDQGDNLFSPMFQLIKMPRSIRTTDIKDYYYYDENGSMQQNSWHPPSVSNLNPYWSMNAFEAPSTKNIISSFLSLHYDIFPGLYVQVRGGLNTSNIDKEEKTYWNTPYINAGHGDYYTYFSKNTTFNGDILVAFEKKISNNISIGLNAGSEIKDTKSRWMEATAGGLSSENKFALDYAEALSADDYESHIQKQSVYGFGQLGFKDYLFLNITARNDWSSTLPSPSSYFYPSVGLTGIISEMISMPKFVSFAKIRISYAEVGNDANFAQTKQTYGSNTDGVNGTIYPNVTRAALDLVPEKSKSWEFGVDLKFLQNRLGIDVTSYKSNTYNQLMCITAAPTSGYSQTYVNCGNIQNKGIEVMLYATPVRKKDFSWDLSMNFSKNKNKVVELSETLDKYEIETPNLSVGNCYVIKGKPYGELYTKGFERDDNNNIIVAANGMPKIESESNYYLGNFNYDWRSGLTNTFVYKGWNLSFLIDLNYGGVRGSGTESMMTMCGTSEASLVGREDGILIDGVFEDGTVNDIRIDAESYYRAVGGRISNGCGELFSHDATNSRLRELAFGYTFPIKSNLVKSLKLSVVGRNLFYIYNDCDWFDPDVTYNTDSNGQGAESAFLPGTRTVGFNIKLSL